MREENASYSSHFFSNLLLVLLFIFPRLIFFTRDRARKRCRQRAYPDTTSLTLPLHELLFVNLLLMHSLHMPRNVHLLLRSVDTVRTLELGLLAALPLLMVP